jgi:hypothetical protein
LEDDEDKDMIDVEEDDDEVKNSENYVDEPKE